MNNLIDKVKCTVEAEIKLTIKRELVSEIIDFHTSRSIKEATDIVDTIYAAIVKEVEREITNA